MRIIPRFMVWIAILSTIFCGVFEIGTAYSDAAEVPDSEHIYGMLGVVVDLNSNEDLVSVSNWNGDIWQFHGVEDWNAGDFVDLVMWDNNTEATIYDDVILSATYERVDLVVSQSTEDFRSNLISVCVSIEFDGNDVIIVCMDESGKTWELMCDDEWHVGDIVELEVFGSGVIAADYKGSLSLIDMAKYILMATE